MAKGHRVTEAPAVSPQGQPATGDAATTEPRLRTDQIQGNIIPGFLKDHRTMLFLQIKDVKAFRVWLKALIPFIATADEVLAFNRLFKEMRFRRQTECNTVKATWINVAFSFAGLQKISKQAKGLELDKFKDEAFRQGLAARSGMLNDPSDSAAEGNAKNWRIGGPGNEADLVLILESDTESDLFNEVERVENTIFAFRVPDSQDAKDKPIAGDPAPSGLALLYKQNGATLPGSLTGHEHFGFKDGVSQPGIRGMDRFGQLITRRQNPRDRKNQGKPGQDLLWPGEFVFGYPGQNPKAKEFFEPGKDRLNDLKLVPRWAQDGSYLVFRRLRQDVGRFHQFLNDVAKTHETDPGLVGARLVGRWASGAPAVTAKMEDDADLADDDCRNNNFEFDEDKKGDSSDEAEETRPQPSDCQNVEEPAIDPSGLGCPFAGHIRKSYPRNDMSPQIQELDEVTIQTHRILRRGIPWGPSSSSTPHASSHDVIDRGLLFLCYQTSIQEQFEFITQNWVNNSDFKVKGSGHDMIIGQSDGPGRDRECKIHLPTDAMGDEQKEVTIRTQDFKDVKRPGQNEWVIPTGGGYFFAPSVNGLRLLAQ